MVKHQQDESPMLEPTIALPAYYYNMPKPNARNNFHILHTPQPRSHTAGLILFE